MRDNLTTGIYLRVDTSSGISQNLSTLTGVLDGAWHHVAFTIDHDTGILN